MFPVSVKNLNLVNIVISIALVGLSFTLRDGNSLTGLDILGIIVFIFSIANMVIVKQISDNISKYILLITFLSAILASFMPFIGGFSDNTNLFIAANSISALWLIILFFTNYKNN